MAYDEQLANRIRRAFNSRLDITERTERKMFGGLAFLCHGRKCCGVVGRDVMVRIPDDMPLVSREILGRGHVVRARVEELRAARDWIERSDGVLGNARWLG
jgi:hypothetical protein